MADPSVLAADEEPQSSTNTKIPLIALMAAIRRANRTDRARQAALEATPEPEPQKNRADDEAEPDEMIVQELDGGLVFQRASAPFITKHFENNAQMWAAPLNKEDYMQLQRQLSVTDASQGDTAYWMLTRKEDPETIVSSCTAYIRDAMINVGDGMHSVNAVVITDIFTIPEERRKGMATKLLKKVQETLDKREKRVEFSLIWSDNRPEFYDRLGWKAQPANTLRIRLPKDMAVEAPAETNELEYASIARMAEIVKRDIKMTKCRFTYMRDKTKIIGQLIPTHKLLRWHAVRTVTMKGLLAGCDPIIGEGGWLGASWLHPDNRTQVWAWWAPDYRTRRLFVARLITVRLDGMEKGIKELLKAAVAEASLLGFREVVMWEPTDQVIKAAGLLIPELPEGTKTFVEERIDMVPCLRWHGGEERAGGIIEPEFYGWS
ncbi:Acyl CoA acyltransferase-like protein [Purpureocillium lavendulum]|uniref:Acyl CoA acyltransferase-like protein n=1 Tax=Purpureocillium lavendulum TaxID=1247861 RepID=A0AB34FY95_9HYPO|nr:Acyl CoA acyltransferase-like protein [Purpureocillium lavendulum]